MMSARRAWGTRVAVVALLAQAAPAVLSAQMQSRSQPRTQMQSQMQLQSQVSHDEAALAAHLLSRATWGVRTGDVAALQAAGGRTAWLDRQLKPAAIADAAMSQRLDAFPTTRMSMVELYRDFSPDPQQQAEQRRMQALRDSLGDDVVRQMMAMTPEQRAERQARNPARLLNELVFAKVQRSVHTERQLEDVMTDFWFNHFNVFFNKGQDRYLVGDYERTAIRPHVFGRFEDMLKATAQHPAMLFYLDNWQSVHVDTMMRSPQQVAQRARNRGLNENYARELLELHTLGVDGGYTQQDVIAVARAFTGWSFQPYNARQAQAPMMDALQQRMQQQRAQQQRQRAQQMAAGARGAQAGRGAQPLPAPYVGPGDVPFIFRPELHDRGEKLILGTRMPAGRGMEDGLDVIAMLSRHPSTARHIATKLVERFVSDEPPAALVDHIADVFLRTDGDLAAVTRALFTADAFYSAEHRANKVKTPYELVVSALRATGADVRQSQRVMQLLRTMGHLPYTEPAPTGFPAMSEDWVNTGAMLNRMNFGLDLAAGRVDGARIDPAAFQPAVRAAAGAAPPAPGMRGEPLPVDAVVDAVLVSVLPGVDTARLAERIREDIAAQQDMQPRQRAVRALGLALGSPEFQRR